MRRPRLRSVIAIGGVLLAFAPLFAAEISISWHARQRARATVSELGRQMLARAEATIDEGLDALAELARGKIAGCGPAALDAMRRTVYAHYSIKAVGIVGENGRILCNHIGDRIEIQAVSRAFPARNGSVHMQIVVLGDAGRRGLMMTWQFDESTGLSVVVPPEIVLPDVLPQQIRATGLGMMTLSDGTLVGTVPALNRNDQATRFDSDTVEVRVASDRYPISIGLFVPYATFSDEMSVLQTLADAGGLLIAIVIIGLVFYAMNRPSSVAGDLRRAMERGEFIPYYQPVIDIQNARLMGCEVLMRHRQPDGTIIPPSMFIGVAEATGLALPMTYKLMEAVREDLDAAFGARPHLTFSVNLFDDHFESLRIVRDIQAIFGPSRIAFGQITLEITERQPLANIDRARVVVRRLQELGSRVALDDAGTGHGGLAYLHQLGIDIIKIDKLFIDTIVDANRHPSPILDSLIKLGQELGMELVAEGVEAIEQVEYLRSRGVAAAQGYLFAPPLPARAFLDLIEAMDPIAAGGVSEAGELAVGVV